MIVQRMTHVAFRAVRKGARLARRVPGSRSVELFGRRLRFTRDSIIRTPAAVLYPRRGWENTVAYTDFVQTHAVVKHLEGLVDPPTVMDIGAFHGFYAVLLGRVVAERAGSMVAVEPNPVSFDVLGRNVRLNRLEEQVACVQAAVGERSGRAAFDGDRGQARVGEGAASGTSVPMTTVGRLAAEHAIERLDVLIVDVEGFELPVLRGIPPELPVGLLFCELHPYLWAEYGYGWRELLDWLDQRELDCLDAYLRPIDRPMGDAYLGPVLMMPRRSALPRRGASAVGSRVAPGTADGRA